MFEGYVAQTDFPGAAMWRDIVQAFPDALVVLSTRPAESWYRSSASTVFQLGNDHDSSPFQSQSSVTLPELEVRFQVALPDRGLLTVGRSPQR